MSTSDPPPPSTRSLTALANPSFTPSIPLRYWLTTCTNLLTSASIYEASHNDPQAYILLLRFAELAIKHLPYHPEATRLRPGSDIQARLRNVVASVPGVMTRLEGLKGRIDARWREWSRRQRERGESAGGVGGVVPIQYRQQQHTGAWGEGVLVPQNGEGLTITPVVFSEEATRSRSALARELQERELQRRASERVGRRASGRYAGAVPRLVGEGEYESYRGGREEEFDLAGSIRALGRMSIREDRERERERERGKREERREERAGSWRGSYPSVPKRGTGTIREEYEPAPTPSRSSTKSTPTLPPKIPHPPKKIEIQMDDTPPPIPSKIPPPTVTATTPSSALTLPTIPPVDPIKKEESLYSFTPSAYLENGTPLRTLFLPKSLRTSFLSLASPNTTSNLETCGILCGTLISNALFVSVLVIPEQESTSDTCQTKDEEDLFEYVFSQDLLILGWIHTHPTQTCFMSSVDCHTQCGYQLMLEESVAVVCAPRSTPDWGVFRLTNPPGIPTITNCRDKGLFHPHPGVREGELYCDALRPGHVALVDTKFEVVDLRK